MSQVQGKNSQLLSMTVSVSANARVNTLGTLGIVFFAARSHTQVKSGNLTDLRTIQSYLSRNLSRNHWNWLERNHSCVQFSNYLSWGLCDQTWASPASEEWCSWWRVKDWVILMMVEDQSSWWRQWSELNHLQVLNSGDLTVLTRLSPHKVSCVNHRTSSLWCSQLQSPQSPHQCVVVIILTSHDLKVV